MCITKLVIILGFGIFYFEDLGQLSQFFLNITGISMIANSAPFTDPMTFSSLRNNIFLILFAILVSLPVFAEDQELFSREQKTYRLYHRPRRLRCGLYGVARRRECSAR